MPIYEYQCKCGNQVEEVQMIGEEPPVCNCGAGMERKVSRLAVIKMVTAGIPVRSKGYKEGYSKEYLKDVQTQ